MNAIVIGGSGQIGGWLLRHLHARGHSAVGTYNTTPVEGLFPYEPGASPEALVEGLRPRLPGGTLDAVFYPAGFTWVDGCEREPEKALDANLHQPLGLAHVADSLGARFVYFSTDYVFDGHAGPYTEADPISPLSAYGRSKAEAEVAIAIRMGYRGHLTVRTSWVFGPERQGKNFAYQLARTLKAGKPLACPSDQISSPSYAPDVAETVVKLVESGVSGTIHVTGPEVMDRPTFARAIARAFGLDESLITSQPTASLGQGAPRPLNGGLLNRRLAELGVEPLRPLDAALADFVENLRNKAN